MATLRARGVRSVRRLLGRSRTPPPSRFAEYLALDGPLLVGGPVPRHDPRRDADPRLVVLLPHLRLARMTGGSNTILQVTARLVPLGLRLRYVATSGPLDPDAGALLGHLRRVTSIAPTSEAVELVDASAPGAELALGASDVLLATWWPTAHIANAALEVVRAREFLYLVQDFEPGFYPWSTKHALASATYAMPMRAIVNEPLLLEHLRTERAGRFASMDPGGDVVSFMPAVDRALFIPRRSPGNGRHRLVFYARPRSPRNLFELGLRALRVAIKEGVFDRGDWEFRAIGQELVDLPLSDSAVLRASPWLAYDDYARVLGEADLLLSLMLSPHTSYPPLEMAVAGGLVVTNTFGVKTAEALEGISPAIRAAAPDVASLVAAIRESVSSIEQDARPVAAVALPGSWDDALAEVIPWLKQTVQALREP